MSAVSQISAVLASHPARHSCESGNLPLASARGYNDEISRATTMTLLQQLEDATCGATDEAERRERAGAAWRGYAFTLAGLNLVIPRTADIQIAPAREVQPLPMCREWVVGMMTVGDAGVGGRACEVFSVIDLAKFLRRDAAGNVGHSIAGGASLILVSGEAFNVGLLVNGRISVRVFYETLDGDCNSDYDGDDSIAPFLTASFPHGAQTWHVLNVKALTQAPEFISIGTEIPACAGMTR